MNSYLVLRNSPLEAAAAAVVDSVSLCALILEAIWVRYGPSSSSHAALCLSKRNITCRPGATEWIEPGRCHGDISSARRRLTPATLSTPVSYACRVYLLLSSSSFRYRKEMPEVTKERVFQPVRGPLRTRLATLQPSKKSCQKPINMKDTLFHKL